MGFKKALGAVKTVNVVRNSENPGEAAGQIAAGAAIAAHPILGTMASPLIKRGVSAGVNKGIEIAKNPDVQNKVREIGQQTQSRVQSGIRDISSNVSGRVAHFRDSISSSNGQNNGESHPFDSFPELPPPPV
jgi:hypothetical protein